MIASSVRGGDHERGADTGRCGASLVSFLRSRLFRGLHVHDSRCYVGNALTPRRQARDGESNTPTVFVRLGARAGLARSANRKWTHVGELELPQVRSLLVCHVGLR